MIGWSSSGSFLFEGIRSNCEAFSAFCNPTRDSSVPYQFPSPGCLSAEPPVSEKVTSEGPPPSFFSASDFLMLTVFPSWQIFSLWTLCYYHLLCPFSDPRSRIGCRNPGFVWIFFFFFYWSRKFHSFPPFSFFSHHPVAFFLAAPTILQQPVWRSS